MAGPYTTTDQIKARVAAMLHKDVADLPAWWDTLIPDARDYAYSQIVTEAGKRGFSIAQTDRWILRKTYERDLALWHLFMEGAGMDQYDRSVIQDLNLLEKLATITFVDETTGLRMIPENPSIGFGYVNDDKSVFKRQVDANGELDQTKW